MKRKPNQNRGLSLVELLLAVSISGIILLTLYRSFGLGLEVYSRVGAASTPEAQNIVHTLSEELRSAYLYPHKRSSLYFSGTPNSLTFISTTRSEKSAADCQRGDLQKVAFHLMPTDRGDSNSLIYEQTDLQVPIGQKAEKKRISLSSKIKSIKFRYFDGQKWELAWNSNQRTPQSVEITVELFTSAQHKACNLFSTIIVLPCGN